MYYKDNCSCEEIYFNGKFMSLKLTPINHFVLRTAIVNEEGEVEYSYSDGFILIPAKRIDALFPTIEAIPLNEVGGEADV